MKNSLTKISYLFATVALLAACGGGGDNTTPPAPPSPPGTTGGTTGGTAGTTNNPPAAQGTCAQAYVNNVLTFVVPRGQSCSTEIPGVNPGVLNTFACTSQGAISQTGGLSAGSGVITFSEAKVQCTSAYVGAYAGTYTGADAGSFNVTINNFGVVSGQLASQNSGGAQYPVNGQVASNGALSATATAGTAGSANYTGTITPTGGVSGTWQYVSPLNGSGTFSGQRSAAQ
jgi:hypothetical protein